MLALVTVVTLEVISSAFGQSPAQISPQPPAQANVVIPLSVTIVLSKDFCSSKHNSAQANFFTVLLCDKLEPVLKSVFASLSRTNAPANPGGTQLTLEPKLTGFLTKAAAEGGVNVYTSVEWTARDAVGGVVWADTIVIDRRYTPSDLDKELKQRVDKNAKGNIQTQDIGYYLGYTMRASDDQVSQLKERISQSAELRHYAEKFTSSPQTTK
jgi:hypothetical protein